MSLSEGGVRNISFSPVPFLLFYIEDRNIGKHLLNRCHLRLFGRMDQVLLCVAAFQFFFFSNVSNLFVIFCTKIFNVA